MGHTEMGAFSELALAPSPGCTLGVHVDMSKTQFNVHLVTVLFCCSYVLKDIITL
jgi:hypothetical protein